MKVGCSSSDVFRLLSSENPPMASKILCKSSSLDPPELSPASSGSLLPISVGLNVGLKVGFVSSDAPSPPELSPASSGSLLPISVGLNVGLKVGFVSSDAPSPLSPPPPPQSALALSQSNPASSANSRFSLHTSHAIQSYAFETRAYTPGNFGSAHPIPQDTTPTCVSPKTKGPPESP